MDPAEERRDMKKKKEYFDTLGYVADSEYGIPTTCYCGSRMIEEVGGEKDKDTVPGKRFFTCNNYKADGLHYRQPWVFGVQEEIGMLNKRLKEAEKRVSEAEQVMYVIRHQCETLEAQVHTLNELVTEMENKINTVPGPL